MATPPPQPPPPPSGDTPPRSGPGAAPPPTPAAPAPGSAPAASPAPPTKRSNRGCIIALAVVGILAFLGVLASIMAVTFLGNAADDAIEDATQIDGDGVDIPGVLGGDCLEFQLAYSTLSLSAFSAGADEAQQQELEEALDEMGGKVPDEIADDFEVVSDAYREAMQIYLQSGGVVGGAGAGPSSEDIERADEILAAPEVVEAQENINTWLEQNCA